MQPSSDIAQGLLASLSDRGLRFTVDGDQLHITSADPITGADLALIRANKAALIDLITRSEIATIMTGSDPVPLYTCPGCNQRVPCAETHPCPGLDDLPTAVPFAKDFIDLCDWHLARIRTDRAASLALYRNLYRRGFTLTVSNLELSITPDNWLLDDEDRAAVRQHTGWLIEHVLYGQSLSQRGPDDPGPTDDDEKELAA